MNETEAERALLTSLSDQTRAFMRDSLPDLKCMATRHPSLWSEHEYQLAWATINAVTALILEGAI